MQGVVCQVAYCSAVKSTGSKSKKKGTSYLTIVVLRHSSAYCIRIALHTIQVKGERKGKERKQKLRLTSDFPHLKQINKAHSMPVMDSYRPALLLRASYAHL